MKMLAAWRIAFASDPGLRRTVNEDRVLADELHGVFLVVDGLGGHAAGEMAAETALRIIQERAASLAASSEVENAIREAIAEANNRIFQLAGENPDWQGMACVLTLAVAQEDRVTVGHVGDSRLYLAWNGKLRKLTSDHSPVGELEDRGELAEEDAMRHPRRNEVFRDVGSNFRQPDDPQFIDTKTFLFRSDAALLICSDGLTDVLTAEQIGAVIDDFDGDPENTVRRLVDAANEAGGKDNVSVVFVAGPEFSGAGSHALTGARTRHAITRMRRERSPWWPSFQSILWLLLGMILGMLLWALLERLIPRPAPQPADSPLHAALVSPARRPW